MKPKTWTRKTTIAILISTVSLLIAWDIWVYIEPTEGDTISEVVYAFGQEHIIFVLIVGVVMGHLFWAQRIKTKSIKGEDNEEEEEEEEGQKQAED